MIDVTKQICNILYDVTGVSEEKINPMSGLIDDLGCDDIDMIDICIELENKFNLHIEDGDSDKWSTVQNIIEYVNTSLKNNGRI